QTTSDLLGLGHTVVVDSQANIAVLGTTFGNSWLAKFSPDLEPQWDTPVLSGDPAGLALGPDDELLIGGMHQARAHAQQINPTDGTEVWLGGIADKPSSFSAVAMAGSHAVSVGYHGLIDKTGLLVRHDRASGVVLTTIQWASGPLSSVVVD